MTAPADPVGFTCPRCGRTSYHPQDLAHGYCGACHAFTGKPGADRAEPDEPFFHIDFGTGQTVDLDELRRRRMAFMPDNTHAWVISVVYGLDDPEQALDTMELGHEQFVGVTPIVCLLCNEKYRSANRFHKCPQNAPGEPQGEQP